MLWEAGGSGSKDPGYRSSGRVSQWVWRAGRRPGMEAWSWASPRHLYSMPKEQGATEVSEKRREIWRQALARKTVP